MNTTPLEASAGAHAADVAFGGQRGCALPEEQLLYPLVARTRAAVEAHGSNPPMSQPSRADLLLALGV